MKLLTSNLISLASVALLFIGACSNGNQTANTENTSNKTPTAVNSPVSKSNHGSTRGGQVVETGKYHLEFLAEKEAAGNHLDLYLLTGDTHETVPDAKVMAQVQLPDGKEKTVPFTYSAKDKHYTGMLNEKTSGQYQVRVTADVKGEKVNGRFSFNR
jgi:hypothetical protein